MKYYKKGAIVGLKGEIQEKDIVEAVQFTGVNRFLIDLKRMLGPDIVKLRMVEGKNLNIIENEKDNFLANHGDYIIRMEGEIIPLKPYVFESKFIQLDKQ